MNLEDKKHLAARLKHLADQLPKSDPPNTRDYAFYRTGLVLLRAGLAYIDSGDRAYRLAVDNEARGYPAGGTEPSRGSSNDTSTERAALNGSDQWEQTRIMLEHERRVLEDNAYAAEHRVYNVVHVEERTGRTSTLIECANRHCDTTLTGLGEDRPRQGRCERCYRFRLRTGRDWTSNQDAVA